jgi:hypothetical protein
MWKTRYDERVQCGGDVAERYPLNAADIEHDPFACERHPKRALKYLCASLRGISWELLPLRT